MLGPSQPVDEIVTNISVSSTNDQLPTAAAVWTAVTNADDGDWTIAGTDRYYNGGDVGIGLTNPARELDVNGRTRLAGNTTDILQIVGSFGSTNFSGNAIGVSGAVDMFISRATGQSINFQEGGSAADFSINPGGEVKIGTGTPNARLDVAGDMRLQLGTNVNEIVSTLAIPGTLTDDQLITAAVANELISDSISTNQLWDENASGIYRATDNVAVGTSVTNQAQFNVQTTTEDRAIRVVNSTASPSANKTGVFASISSTGNSINYGFRSNLQDAAGRTEKNVGLRNLMSNNGTGDKVGVETAITGGGTGTVYGMHFTDGATGDNIVYGTYVEEPTDKAATFYGHYVTNGTMNGGESYGYYYDQTGFGADDAYGFYMNAGKNYMTGNLGIGSGANDPSAKLQIDHNGNNEALIINTDGTVSSNAGIRINNTGNGSNAFRIFNGTAPATQTYRISTEGDVSALGSHQITMASTGAGLRVQNGNAAGEGIVIRNSGTNALEIRDGSNALNGVWQSDGNVGIGIANPSSPLEINATTNTTSLVSLTQSGDDHALHVQRNVAGATEPMAYFVQNSSTSTERTMYVTNAGTGDIFAAGGFSAGEIFVIDDEARVGIGTTVPGNPLDVETPFGGYSISASNSNTNGRGIRVSTQGNSWGAYMVVNGVLTTTNPAYWFDDNNTSRTGPSMRITSGTSVGSALLVEASGGDVVIDADGNIDAQAGDFYAATNNGVINCGGGIMNNQINIIADNSGGLSEVNGDEDLYIEDDLEVDGIAYKSTTTWTVPSDRRMKHSIRPYEAGLDEITQVKTYRFRYKEGMGISDIDRDYIGIVAQELAEIAPYMVDTIMAGEQVEELPDGTKRITKRGTERLVFNGSAFTFMTINAIQELDQQQAEQNDELEQLRTENDQLKQRLEQLETNAQTQTQQMELLQSRIQQLEQLIGTQASEE